LKAIHCGYAHLFGKASLTLLVFGSIFLVLEVACLAFILEYHHGTSKGLMRSFSGLLNKDASVKLPFGTITCDKFAEVTQAIEKMSQ